MDRVEHTDHIVAEVCRLKCQDHNKRYRTACISHKKINQGQFGFFTLILLCAPACVCICV